jgi:hypothetical protein
MARGKKTGGRDFQPGNQMATLSTGKSRSSAELQHVRKLTSVEFERISNQFMHYTLDELEEADRDKSLTVIERMVIAVIQGALMGEHIKLAFLLDRLLGRSVERVEHSGHLSLASLVAQAREELETDESEPA